MKVVIDNIKGDFSSYDFFDAKLTLWLGVEGDVDSGDNQRYYRIGFYVVDEPSYNGSLITLNCLDNMTWFDVPFESISTTNTTAGALVSDICSHVGVTLGTATFPNYTLDIDGEVNANATCREVVQYVAQMCCCYCKIDTAGELVLKWYDKDAILGITNYDGGTYNTTTTPYSDGCDLDGGHFMYGGDNADGGTFQDLLNGVWLSNNFDMNVSTDDVVVTGCRIRNSSKDNAYDELWVDSTLEQTHERYVLVIDNNPFINTTNAGDIANIVGSILAGLPIRAFTATSLSDFSIETGDMATIIDFRGNRYYTWITHFTFTTNNSETFACGVESLRTRSEQRFSTSAETVNKANIAITEYDKAVKAMTALAMNSIDYNEYVYPVGATVGQTRTVWRYNGNQISTTSPASPTNPYFYGSTVVIKISGDGTFVAKGDDIDASTGEVLNYSNGYDANSGTAILDLLYVQGIVADWLKVNNLSAITANMGTLTAGSITGGTITGTTSITSYFDNSDQNGYTQISGGNCYVYADSSNYFRVRAKGVSGTREVTMGPHISVRDTDQSFMVERSLRYLGWAVEDAYTAHSSDKKLKKKIKDIPVKKSRELILGARPRYYEFKKSIENGPT